MMEWCFVHVSYYLMWLMFVGWLAALWPLKAFSKSIAIGLASSLVLTVIIFMTVPVGLKIFNDEVRLLSVSKSMAAERRCDSVRSAVEDPEGHTAVLKRNFEKRPLLLPFLGHFVHLVKGYDARALNAVNFLFAWLSLFIVSLWLGPVLGFAGMLAVIAHPVFPMSATSAGMEIVNLFFILLAFFLLDRYLDKKDDASFRALLMTLVVGAHARYESGLFLALTFAVLIACRALPIKTIKASLAHIAASVVFLLPVFWQRWVKLDSQEPSSVKQAFDIGWIPQNTLLYLKSLTRMDLGVNNWIDALGILACVVLVSYGLKKKKVFTLALIAGMGALWLLTTAYYSGNVDGRFSARFFMLHGVLFSVLSVLLLERWLKNVRAGGWIVLIASAAALVPYYPLAMQNIGVRESYFRRDYDNLNAWVAKRPAERAIYICPMPEYLLVHGYSAVDFRTADKKWDYLQDLVRTGRYEAIYAVLDRKVSHGEIPKKYRIASVSADDMELISTFPKGETSSFRVYKVSTAG